MSRLSRLAASLLTVVAVVLLTFAPPVGAHTAGQSLVYLDVTDQALGGRVELSLPDLEEFFGLDVDGTPEELHAELEGALPELQAYAADHLEIVAGGEVLPLTFDGVDLLSEEIDDEKTNFAQLFFVAEPPADGIPRTFDVTFDPFFDELEGRNALLLIGSDAQTGLYENAEDVLVAFDPGVRTQSIDLGSADRWGNFSSSVRLGVDHIKTGPDHVLFVLILLLPSVLVFASGWRPEPTFGAALWRVLKIVTMFTVAHSITFTLAGLGILPLPPSKIVEAIIAVSIALAALHNIRPVFPNHEWVIAFFFGLFHGMGFASLVEGLDVGRSTQLISLLGRNVGIEIGQSVVVLLCFPALYLLRRTRFFIPGFVAISVLMALVSLGWMVERLGEVDFGINGFVDPVLKMPRALYLVAIGTAVAAVIRQVEANAGRLLPVYDRGAVAAKDDRPPRDGELVDA